MQGKSEGRLVSLSSGQSARRGEKRMWEAHRRTKVSYRARGCLHHAELTGTFNTRLQAPFVAAMNGIHFPLFLLSRHATTYSKTGGTYCKRCICFCDFGARTPIDVDYQNKCYLTTAHRFCPAERPPPRATWPGLLHPSAHPGHIYKIDLQVDF